MTGCQDRWGPSPAPWGGLTSTRLLGGPTSVLSLSHALCSISVSLAAAGTRTPHPDTVPPAGPSGLVTDRPSRDRQSAHAQAAHGPRCCVLPPYLHGLRWGLTTIWGPCRASPLPVQPGLRDPQGRPRTPLLPAPPTALTAPETKTRLSAMPLQTPPNPARAH